jgi:hypothetical protein
MWKNGLLDTLNERYRNHQQSTIFEAKTDSTSTSASRKDLLSYEEVIYHSYCPFMLTAAYAYRCSKPKRRAWLHRVPAFLHFLL